jgi:mannosyl-oligosaccharide glucosidase
MSCGCIILTVFFFFYLFFCFSGPIWMPLNYLAVRALKHYATAAESAAVRNKASALYAQLRANLLRTVVGGYEKTGFFWEQYDDESGEGIRGHPFTGWTAIIVNILTEKY